jgi:chemotaxis protein methyltransferase CheR
MSDGYDLFKKQIKQLSGINLDSYKENQMKRRLDSLLVRNKLRDYHEYISLIKGDRTKLEEFISFMTINVSEFWRNTEQWAILDKSILPGLIKGEGIKVWSAACATGDEPYSLVMLLSKYLPLSKIRVLATDIDKQILQKAKEGIYPAKSLKGLPHEFKVSFFTETSPGMFSISDEVKRCVTFREHNLLTDPYPIGCDLILCRNVLIYFTNEAKEGIYFNFNKALNKGGILFLGNTEQILYPQEYNFTLISSFFYKKQ